MKKAIRRAAALLLPLFLTAGMTAASIPSADAAQTASAVAAGITRITVDAERLNQNASEAINEALMQARKNATDANPYTVVVPPGEYTLTDTLDVYSNTTLVLQGVTLSRCGVSNLLRVGAGNITGYHFRNITVEGGTFDGVLQTGTMFKLSHAFNLTLRGVTAKNNYNTHMAEVACVDGFNLLGCTFDNQQVDDGFKQAYEQVQIDVLAPGNFDGYGYEDLPVCNVLVENCTFQNAPRGIGSHTAVLNAPHRNITIRDNRFSNMKSVALQTLGWADSRIIRNRIDNATRGIAVYETDSSGTSLPSYLAQSGGTEQHFSDDYTERDCNILIDSNVLTDCGLTADPYASYERSAISVMGANVKSGSLPHQIYPCRGVSVTNNLVRAKGNGVRVEYASRVNIDGNVVNLLGTANTDNHGVVCRYDTDGEVNIRKNFITDAPTNGIYANHESVIGNINNNEIFYAGKYGIGIDGATVKTMSNNDVRHTSREGIAIVNGGQVTNTLIGCRVIDGGNYGVHVTSDSYARRVEKNLARSCSTAYGLYRCDYANSNYEYSESMTSFKLDRTEVTLALGESYRVAKTPSPLQSSPLYSYKSGNGAVAVIDENTGRVTAVAPGVARMTVTSDDGQSAVFTVNVTSPEGAPAVGDTDGDGIVSAADSALIAGFVSRMQDYESIDRTQADVNADGSVNAKDRIILSRHVARREGYDTLPMNVTGTAKGQGALSLRAEAGQPGGTFPVEILLDNNPGIATADLELSFDSTALSVDHVEDGGLCAEMTAEHSDAPGAPYHLSWANDLAQTDSTACGRLATVWFRVSDDAQPGRFRIGWNTDAQEIYNSALQTVSFGCAPTEVEITPRTYTVLLNFDQTVYTTGSKSAALIPAGETGPRYFAETKTETDEWGWIIGETFGFSAVPAGDYTLRVNNPGFLPCETALTVTGDMTANVALTAVGDLNRDGSITDEDLQLLDDLLIDGAEGIPEPAAADVTGDGTVNAKDRSVLFAYLRGVLTSLPFDTGAVSEQSGAVAVEAVQTRKGDTAELRFAITENPGINEMTFEVVYDDRALQLESAEDGALLPGTSFRRSKDASSPCRFAWRYSTGFNSTATGTILTLRFKVLDEAAPGAYAVGIRADSVEFYDRDLNLIPFTFSGGGVEVLPAAATVSGTVRGGQGVALIELIPAGGTAPAFSARTQNGAFTLNEVDAGSYTLRVSKDGCLTEERIITVGDDLHEEIALRLIGDADGDGTVSISDVTAIQREIAEYGNVPDPEAADADGDGKITVADATLIQRRLAEFTD